MERNELPEGWKRVKLGEVIEENPKSTLKVEDADLNGVYPFFTSGESTLSHSDYLVDGENLFISTGGTAYFKFYKGKAIYSADTYSVKGKNGINTKFLYYHLLRFQDNITYRFFIGSGLEHLQKPYFKSSFLLPLPPLPEQQKIAEILETVDRAIEKTEKIIEKYKRIKQGLMQDLLTKGVVIEGESWRLRNEKTDKFKDSPIGRIPEEWEIVRLGDVTDVKLSNVDKKIDFKEKIVRLCNYLEVYQNDYIIKEMNFMYASATNNEIKKFKISKGDVIITKDSEEFNDIAKPSYVKDEIENLVCGYHLALVKPLNDIDGLFLSKILSFKNVNLYFQKRANGITRFGLTKETITNAIIPLPPLPEQQKIAEILSRVDEVIDKEEKYKEKLEHIKIGLMEDLLTGKVRVNHLIEEVSIS